MGPPSILIGPAAAGPIDLAPLRMPPKVWPGSLAAPGLSWHRTPLRPEHQAQAPKFLWVCRRLLSAASPSWGLPVSPRPVPGKEVEYPCLWDSQSFWRTHSPPSPPSLISFPITSAHPAGLEESFISRYCISPDIWGMSQSSPFP